MKTRPREEIDAREVALALDGIVLHGDLTVPRDAIGLVLFAHGSGSSRFSPRNRAVASALHEGKIATLLLDLLTAEEERVDSVTGMHRFDIGLLADRLVAATDWAESRAELRGLAIGYFGASTGGAAALVAAARRRDLVRAVVSRGGRPDLAGDALEAVRAPTLLIVGGDDTLVLELNREALARLRAEKELAIVRGATHLFEEPGALEDVARQARRWFEQHFPRPVVERALGTGYW